jgi:beta-fructofuranosidase
MSKEILQKNLYRAHEEIASKKKVAQQGKMRQKYHFMAEQGWINDPNGLIYFRGKYHFFYQYNPYDSYWGEMYWGHAISDDMLHWEYRSLALAPSEDYDSHKEGGCFSGSAIEHEGRLYLVYTGTTNYGEGFVQTQCLAYSEDGIHFEKYKNNPVITAPPEGYDKANFRDPKVWKHENQFYLVCGAKKDNLAKVLLYRSDDLKNWKFVNVLAESRGEWGYMWECPDFFQIGDKYVLTFSPMGAHERTAVYLVGDMNYTTGKFIYTVSGEIDWGFDFYAPQSFLAPDGRRIVVGWANAWDWMPWWKDWGPTFKEGWCGAFSLPREVILGEDNTLQFKPVKELESIRQGKCSIDNLIVGSSQMEIPVENGVIFELQMSIDLSKSNADSFTLILRSDGVHQTKIIFDLKKQMMSLDRDASDGWSQGKTKSPLLMTDKNVMMIHAYIDQSSIEVFTDDYKTNHSCNVFAADEQNHNYIIASGGEIKISQMTTWVVKNVALGQ